MAEYKTCYGCKYLKDMRCSNKEGHYYRGFQCSKYASQNSTEIIAEQLSEIAENLYREAETVPVVTEQEDKNMEFKKIEITFKNGETITYDEEQWDDYSYDCKAVIVKKDGVWIGIYNFDNVYCVEVKS